MGPSSNVLQSVHTTMEKLQNIEQRTKCLDTGDVMRLPSYPVAVVASSVIGPKKYTLVGIVVLGFVVIDICI